jgi:hypothetical protein
MEQMVIDETEAPVGVAPALSTRLRGSRRRILPLAGLAVYVVAAAVSWTVNGLPFERDRLFLWLIGGLLAVSLADLKGWLRGVVVDWAPLFVIFYAYDALRAMAADGRVAHWHTQIAFDNWLFGGRSLTVALQHHLWHPGHPHWWDWIVLVVYNSHFCVPLGVAAVLWKVHKTLFRRYTLALIVSTFAGFFTFWLYPAEPPWMASTEGHLSPTTRIIPDLWARAHVKAAHDLFLSGAKYDNPIAAVPSLHAAYPMLLVLVFWKVSRTLRVVLVAYALTMAFSLVYTAEHYVFDILLGWGYAVAGVAVSTWMIRAWQQRRHRHRGVDDPPGGNEGMVSAERAPSLSSS